MKMMKHVYITTDFFPIKVLMVFGEFNFSQLAALCREYSPNSEPLKRSDFETEAIKEGSARATTFNCGPGQIIWFDEVPSEKNNWLTPIMVHELTHAAFNIAEDLGFKPHFDCQEFHGYFLSWAMKSFLDQFKDKAKK